MPANKVKKKSRPKASRSSDHAQSSLRALSIQQPWAELILRGRKRFELRTWTRDYRGPLVIHASGKVDSWAAWELGLNPEKLPTGAFVGVATVSDIRPYTREDARLLKARRAGFGWFPYYFSWVLGKPRRISPVPAKGKLGLFKVPKAIERRIGRLVSAGR